MTAAVNFTATGVDFGIEADVTTLFDYASYLKFKQALDVHTHASTYGAAVARLANAVSGTPTFSGTITVSKTNAHGGAALTSATGTNAVSLQLNSTAGTGYVGMDSSTAGVFGGAAYALCLWAPSSRNIELIPGATAGNRVTVADGGATTVRGGGLILANTIGSLAGGVADQVALGAYDLSAGNATLALGTETAVTAAAAGASDAYLNVRVNGGTYKLLLHT